MVVNIYKGYRQGQKNVTRVTIENSHTLDKIGCKPVNFGTYIRSSEFKLASQLVLRLSKIETLLCIRDILRCQFLVYYLARYLETDAKKIDFLKNGQQ